MTSVTSLNFIPLILGSVFCLVRKESDKNTKIIQIISWVLSFAIIVSQKCRAQNPLAYTIFPRTVFLSIYVFGFISTFHALYLPHRLSSSVFLLIQLAIFALYLICQNDNIYYICCGFFLNSVLTWFTIPKDSNEYNSRAFQLQILTDLCLIFGFFIFLQY
ncbi:MAG: hypothetical protein LBQ43_03605, partial [Holosporales bacterium]|nr:hypothetical protein [Holosporales bacterium]